MEDVGKTKTCGIQSVVVCSPDIKTENENSQIEQVQADHNLKDIISTDKDGRNGTEEEHQRVSDEEGHNRGDGTRFSILCKTCEVLEQVGLGADDPRKYKQFSLGMKQRLGIAGAILEYPALLLIDEPTNALDTDGIEMVRDLLLEQKQRGALVILACHDFSVLRELSDEIYLVREGRVTPYETQDKSE